MCIAVNTLDTNAAYHLSGIRLFGCKDTAEKAVPSVFWKTLVYFVSALLVMEDDIMEDDIQTCLVWIRENGVAAWVHRHM